MGRSILAHMYVQSYIFQVQEYLGTSQTLLWEEKAPSE